MRTMRGFLAVGTFLLMTVSMLDASKASGDPVRAANGSIVFDGSYGEPGNGAVFMMNNDGSEARLFQDHPLLADDYEPTWSPDGRSVVFTRAWTLRRATAVGPVETFPGQTGWNRMAAVSPDGAHIAFSHHPEASYPPIETQWDLWVMDAAGGDARSLVNTPGKEGWPEWSPDSRSLLFVRSKTGGEDDTNIWLYRLRSGNLTGVIGGPGPQTDPTWSPDGRRIAYVGQRQGFHVIQIKHLRTGRTRRLTTQRTENEYSPAFSPDGRWIAFIRWSGDLGFTIHKIRADGSGPTVDITPAMPPGGSIGDNLEWGPRP